MKQRSNTPLLLAIVAEAMGYGAIFGLLADRWGRLRTIALGYLILAASVAVIARRRRSAGAGRPR